MTTDQIIQLDIKEIQRVLPHRYPFIMLDRVTEAIPGQRAKGFKNVTVNEPYFPGHFGEIPIMPGVLQLEAAAQLSCIVMLLMSEYQEGYLGIFTGLEAVKFRRKVVPGDRLDLEVKMNKFRFPFGKFDFVGKVGEELSVEGILSFAMVKKEELL
jgi:3-hydroxyacyl-[acyl-carrier-protein] dehydratase